MHKPLTRPDFFTLHNGNKETLPFSQREYDSRLSKLRALMDAKQIEVVLLTSMHNIAYYSGFLYCAFGRPYGCVVTQDKCTTLSANIDAGQPWRRSHGENIIYTDWRRDNFWRAFKQAAGTLRSVGIEHDHMTLSQLKKLQASLDNSQRVVDMSEEIMALRMIKSNEEISLIREGARICDVGGHAIHSAICEGASELVVAMAGRNAVELEIQRAFPQSEVRDNWIWFQSGLNTDGAHNPVTCRKLEVGDILSLNVFPMINGYYTALERTLFLGEPDKRSLEIWEANIGAHELGISLIKPGVSCAQICSQLNRFFAERDLLKYRSFGYGHSFGVLSHYYGREAGLELREDIETVLEPGMVISMEPMLWIPEGNAGAGGYREHDILIVTEDGAENITGFPYGPDHNIIKA